MAHGFTHLFLKIPGLSGVFLILCAYFPGPAAGVGAGCGELQADQGGSGSAASDGGEVRAVGGEKRRLQRRRTGGQAVQGTEYGGAIPWFYDVQHLKGKLHTLVWHLSLLRKGTIFILNTHAYIQLQHKCLLCLVMFIRPVVNLILCLEWGKKTPINQFLFVRIVTLCIIIAMKDDKDQRIHITHQIWTNAGFCELYLEASWQRELATLLMLLSAIKSQKY